VRLSGGGASMPGSDCCLQGWAKTHTVFHTVEILLPLVVCSYLLLTAVEGNRYEQTYTR
jgi:hypothetical protein